MLCLITTQMFCFDFFGGCVCVCDYHCYVNKLQLMATKCMVQNAWTKRTPLDCILLKLVGSSFCCQILVLIKLMRSIYQEMKLLKKLNGSLNIILIIFSTMTETRLKICEMINESLYEQ